MEALLNPGMNFLFGAARSAAPNKKFIPPISNAGMEGVLPLFEKSLHSSRGVITEREGCYTLLSVSGSTEAFGLVGEE